MKFFHVYNEECFKGLEKNNLINRDSGFKVQNVFSVPQKRKFNHIAAMGGQLHSMISKEGYPLYADRISGGIIYCAYPYDKALLKEYRELLGDWFLGVQLHESASNRRVDWKRILKHMNGSHGPYDVNVLREHTLTKKKDTDGTPLYGFSQGTPESYAKMQYADNMQDYAKEIEDMFADRMRTADGLILPCDSYILATRLQDKMGMRSFMPEVGSQIPMMRIAVALARATAKASNKTWGVYYECWRADEQDGKISYNMPCFNLDPINEWYLTQENHGDDFTTHGENGGSSRLLQNRIYYYALMSGADYLSEEWGLNCSYTDMNDYTLSAYGLTKKKFIDTALNMRGMRAKTPIAIVLPTEHSCVFLPEPYVNYENGAYKTMSEFYGLRAVCPKTSAHVEALLRYIYGQTSPSGNEGHVITNSRFGDVFDLVYADASEAVLSGYDCLIDASPDGAFLNAHQNSGLKILPSDDFERMEAQIHKVLDEALPCTADGLCWLVSTDENGQNYLTVLNNEGNMRTSQKGDVIDRDSDAQITVTFRTPCNVELLSCSGNGVQITEKNEKSCKLFVPATEVAILKF